MPTSFQFNSTSPINTQGFAFNIEQLREEILEDAGITTGLGQIIGSDKEDIDVKFIAAISAGEETALNAVVAAHIPRDFGIIIEGLTGEATDVALSSSELNFFNNEGTIFVSNTVQDVIEEISSLSWLDLLDIDVLQDAPILGDVGSVGETGPTGAVGPPGPPGSGGVTNYEFKEHTVDKSTTSNTFVNYTKLITSSLEAGDYRIGWFYLWNGSQSNRDMIVRLMLDDDEENELSRYRAEPSQGPDNARLSVSGFTVQTLSAGVHEIKLDFRRDSNPATVTLFEARIEILKVN
jgi:hypothetical protein